MECIWALEHATEAVETQAAVMRNMAKALRAEDADAIHDVRVASRRLRSALSEYGSLFDQKLAADFRERVRNVTRSLSESRQLDVSLALARELAAKAKGPERAAARHLATSLAAQRKALSPAVKETAAAIKAAEFKDAYAAMLATLKPKKRCVYVRASARMLKRFERVLEARQEWEKSRDNAHLHRLRIELKKFRYTCEIFRKVYGKPIEDLIIRLKKAQEGLGTWHDWFALSEYASAMAAEASANEAPGYKTLQTKLNRKQASLVQRFERQSKQFFSKENRKQVRAMLKRQYAEKEESAQS